MQVDFFLAQTLDSIIRTIASELPHFGPDFEPNVRPADPRFGDFQVNGVLAHAKQLKQNPRALGQELLDALNASDTFDPQALTLSIAGPGFINIELSSGFLLRWLKQFNSPEAIRQAAQSACAGQTVIIDYSAPNTAKEMHVGHIRSTVIGEAIARIVEFAGAKTIRDNHIGDWGTQFGMIIYAIKQSGYDLDIEHENPIADLEQLYKDGNAAYKSSDEVATLVRAELVKLQSGDPENVALWNKITEVSWNAFSKIYTLLDIHFDEVLGESFYRDQVEDIYKELETAGIAEESQGALVVFHPEHKRFATQPFIIRKTDGASNYASTDLATIRYRVNHYRADEILYVVDSRQSDHFEQLFITAKKWFGHQQKPLPKLSHISFGTVLGENGKPLKTKEGNNIKLRELLDEAIDRSFAIVTEKNPDLSEEERRNIARVVGIGSVKYADLSQNRTSDYTFSWSKMLALEGNTAPYLLYAVARIHSIFRKVGTDPYQKENPENLNTFEGEFEHNLAKKLVALPATLEQTLGDFRPHVLCTYLFELAGVFSTFYNAEKVIVDDPIVHQRRLLLCQRTLITLETGLHLLGLETLDRM